MPPARPIALEALLAFRSQSLDGRVRVGHASLLDLCRSRPRLRHDHRDEDAAGSDRARHAQGPRDHGTGHHQARDENKNGAAGSI